MGALTFATASPSLIKVLPTCHLLLGARIYSLYGTESEDGQVMVNMDFHRTMMGLVQRVSQREVLLGWYSTGADLQWGDLR